MKVGLFFGSFNPVHIGHLIIANIMVETSDLNQVWFIVSPQNPLKAAKSLAHEFDRFDMVQAGIDGSYHLRASDIEFNMPRPSYTVDTLAYLADKHPEHEFSLIIGEDNLKSFPKWKNYRAILDNYGLYVYPRPGETKAELANEANVNWVEAPILDISATYIRNLVKQEKSIQYLVPDSVAQIIKSRKLYI
ncbi:MAG: nicotinic acid mononucleotide adenylyltransferase [Bacteroidetes bacterium]|nr:MAG: nicotinic acid mononucleotide adenylyltransferase [Bacteroidota bacterium]